MREQQQWYVLRDARIQGPYSESELSRYMLLGRVRRSDQFSVDGQSWQTIDAVAELIPEALKLIGTEAGWRAYLAERAAVDERASHDCANPEVENRRLCNSLELEDFKHEWLSLFQDARSQDRDQAPKSISTALLLASLGIIGLLALFSHLSL